MEKKKIESTQIFSSSNRRFYFSVEKPGVAEIKGSASMPDWLYVSFKIIDAALKEEETTFQHASSST